VIAHLGDVELVRAEARADGGDQGTDLIVIEDLVDARLFDIEHLAAQRQDRLRLAVAPLLGGAAGRVALDEINFAFGRIALGAVGQLAGQGQTVQHALAAREVTRLARRDAGACGEHRLFDHLARDGGTLGEEGAELVIDDLRDNALDLAVAEFGLGLSLELRLRHFDRDDHRDALADVVASQRLLVALLEVVVGNVLVDGAG